MIYVHTCIELQLLTASFSIAIYWMLIILSLSCSLHTHTHTLYTMHFYRKVQLWELCVLHLRKKRLNKLFAVFEQCTLLTMSAAMMQPISFFTSVFEMWQRLLLAQGAAAVATRAQGVKSTREQIVNPAVMHTFCDSVTRHGTPKSGNKRRLSGN